MVEVSFAGYKSDVNSDESSAGTLRVGVIVADGDSSDFQLVADEHFGRVFVYWEITLLGLLHQSVCDWSSSS